MDNQDKDKESIRKKDSSKQDELWDADPDCKHKIVNSRGGGVVCTKCGGWFCF